MAKQERVRKPVSAGNFRSRNPAAAPKSRPQSQWCALTASPSGLPAPGVAYAVYEARSGKPVQQGRTDRHGRFPLVGKTAPSRPLVAEFYDAAGHSLGRHGFPVGGRAPRFRLGFGHWLGAFAAFAGRRREAPLTAAYDVFAQRLEAAAKRKGQAVDLAAQGLRRAGLELDALILAAEDALAGASGALERLRALTAARGSELAASRQAAPKGKREGGAAMHARRGPAFAPGMAVLWSRVLRLSRRHPAEARALLGTLFALNRDTIGLVRSLARGLNSPDAALPLDLTDPYQSRRAARMPPGVDGGGDDFGGGGFGGGGFGGGGFGGGGPGGGMPDFNSPEGRLQLRCETTLIDALDGVEHQPERELRPGGGGGPVETGEIDLIEPDHEALTGGRSVQIRFVSSLGNITRQDGTVEVTFPGRDGRIAVNGRVDSSVQRADGKWEHAISVFSPVRTREGMVQVRGFPRECLEQVEVPPASDPALQELGGHIDECMGVSSGYTASVGVADGSFTCVAQPVNWAGGLPEMHFRWSSANGDIVNGDIRECSAPPAVQVPQPRLTQTSGLLAGLALERARERPHLAGEWTLARLVDTGPCRLTHESVILAVEADKSVWLEYLTVNELQGAVSLRLSPPIALAHSGAPRHLIDGTLYHVDWEDQALAPNAGWKDIGTLAASAGFNGFQLARAAMPMLARPAIQVLGASARNALVGYRKRGVEILRYLKPATITAVKFQAPDQPRDMAVDRRIGPDERLSVVAVIEPPTYADTGVELTLSLRFDGEDVATQTVVTRSSQPIEIRVATLRMWERATEGTVPVEVSVSYRYTSESQYPGGVALGAQAGSGAGTTVTVLPRIVVMGFMGQWDAIYDSAGATTNRWLPWVLRKVAATLREPGNQQNIVSKLTVTGRVAQRTAPTTGDATVDGFVSSLPGYAVATVLGSTVVGELFGWQTGTFQQVLDPAPVESSGGSGTPTSIVRGNVQMFASEWAFNEGNNEWGQPQRDWGDEENPGQVDFYIDQSGIEPAIRGAMGNGPRKTHFIFLGHSRGAGACFDIMSWLKRKVPAESWSIIAAVYLDAMHTDGFFQPVATFPVCADEMLHFYANRQTSIANRNCKWDGETYYTSCPCSSTEPNCAGSQFEQFEVDAGHGGVPEAATVRSRTPDGTVVEGPKVLDIVHDLLVRKIRELNAR